MYRVIASTNEEEQRIQELSSNYNLDREQAQLALECEKNLDTDAGYKAYYELTKSVVDSGADQDILYDMAANFQWDDKLGDEFDKLAIADGREDLI